MSAEPNGESSPGIKGKLDLMHTIERLKIQTRTGWVNVKVPGRVESIADHMYRMAMLSLLSEEDEDLDIAKCVQMAVVHDLAEALVGDITPHDGISKEQKQKMEEIMTRRNLDPNGKASKRIQALFEEYEQRSTKEARFVKDLDLLEMALQGAEYETDRGSDQIQPFFESSIPKIQHPEVRKWAHELMRQRQERRADDPSYEHVDIGSSSSDKPASSAIETANPLIQLAPSSVPVLDADEEIFDLYTTLSISNTDEQRQAIASTSSAKSADKHHGLGFVDAKKNTLHISIEIPKVGPPTSPTAVNRNRNRRKSSLSHAGPTSPSPVKSPKAKGKEPLFDTAEVEIQQDLGSLHARVGDTGSVVWQASVLLATFLLKEGALPHYNLFMPSLLANAEILELGGGTGVLSTLLAPLVGSWTVTDIPELLPLIQKNHNRNHQRLASSAVDVLELDWTWTEQQFRKNAKQVADHQYHLVFAVDCLYNESLVQPFVNTLNRINTKFVVVVSELRSADVLRMFLELWLESGNWTVYRPTGSTAASGTLSDKATQTSILGRRHVIWIGWKS